MDERLSQLLKLAFRTVPGSEANKAIADVREELDKGELVRSYELVFGPDLTWDGFARDLLPKLVYHLESIGAHLPACADVMLAVFAGGELHFIHARDLVKLAGTQLGLSPADLVRLHGTGESRTAQRGPPLLLV